MITDGNGRFIKRSDAKNNHFEFVNQIDHGDCFSTQKKANNIYMMMPEFYRRRCHVQMIDENTPRKYVITNEDEEFDSAEWQSHLEVIMQVTSRVSDRQEYLNVCMSEIDKEITDLEHFIEFNNLNAYHGYLAYRRMRDALLRRRKIKDELFAVSQIKNCIPDKTALVNVQKSIIGLDNRSYTPRVLGELFAHGIV